MIVQNKISLEKLHDEMVESSKIKPNRVQHTRRSLIAYSKSLKIEDWANCYPADYNLPQLERNELISTTATRSRSNKNSLTPGLGEAAIRNRKNDVNFVLEYAYKMGYFPRPGQAEALPEEIFRGLPPARGENKHMKIPPLNPVPERLKTQLGQNRKWHTGQGNEARNRPRKLKRTIDTHAKTEKLYLRYASYLVHFCEVDPADLTLELLCKPDYVCSYVGALIEFHERTTASHYQILAKILALIHYLLLQTATKEEKERKAEVERLESYRKELTTYRGNLDPPVTVHDKKKRWLSLAQLQQVAFRVYPTKAPEILSTWKAAKTPEQRQRVCKPQAAYDAMTSLLIELESNTPLRQRNLREMLWDPANPENGKNLYRKDGIWYEHFEGKELKVSRRKGKINVYEQELPPEVGAKIEEYLFAWRDMLITNQKGADVGKEKTTRKDAEGQELVFLNRQGRPLRGDRLNDLFKKVTYRFAGKAVNIHMMRTIWATEYLEETQDVIVAAFILGDTVQTVLMHYAHLLEKNAAEKARSWIRQKLYKKGGATAQVSKIKTIRNMREWIKQGLSDEEIERRIAA